MEKSIHKNTKSTNVGGTGKKKKSNKHNYVYIFPVVLAYSF